MARGVVECRLGGGLNSRRPFHGGQGTGAVQGASRLAVGAVAMRLWCGEAREQEWGRGVAWRELGRGGRPRRALDGLGGARACTGDEFPAV